MADLPIELDAPLAERLARCLDVEGKIPRALEALGPVGGRDVLLLGRPAPTRAAQLEALGARVRADGGPATQVGSGSVDVVVGLWDSFRGVDPAEIAEADRVARPGARLLVVHDYGRDDVRRLRGDRPEYGDWSRARGTFLSAGFRIRVIHCFWTFESLEDAADFLDRGFGAVGREVAASMTRPRLSYNVAVYHRAIGGRADGSEEA